MAKHWDGVRRANLHGGLHEMEIISGHLFSVAVHVDTDPEFRAFILAAGSAHSLGNRSIDSTLRKHSERWISRFEKQEAQRRGGINDLYQRLLAIVDARCSAISSLDLTAVPIDGQIAAANAFIRLDSTFSGALLLIRGGYAFESEAVIRLGLEQIAWAYGIRNLATFGEVQRTSGTGWTSALKTVFPGVGRMYGLLSKLAHLAPATHRRFIRIDEYQAEIKIQMPEAVLQSTVLLLILLDAFLVVSEKCLQVAGLPCKNIDPASGSLCERREVSQLLLQYKNALPGRAQEFFDSWWK